MMPRRIPTTLVAGVAALSLAVSAPASQAGAQQSGAMKDQSTGAEQGAVTNQQQKQMSDEARASRQGRSQSAATQRDRDAMLEDQVFVRLAERAWAGGDFAVSARDGAVTIAGTVPDEESRQRILRVVRRTIGVLDVRDRLKIDTAAGTRPLQPAVSDSQLSQRVAEKIAGVLGAKAGEDWWFTGWRVEGPSGVWSFVVEADEGRINLEGNVPRPAVVRKAVQAAVSVSGVRSVRSDLAVDPAYVAYMHHPGYPHPYGHVHTYYPYGYVPYGWGYRPGPYLDSHMTVPYVVCGDSVHAMTGEVTAVDHDEGTVSVHTGAGDLRLRVPPAVLEGIDRGERVGVEIRQLEGSAAGG